MGQRLPISAVGGHGIVGVGHRDDAADERDSVGAQALWITGAVPGLMVTVAAGNDIAHEWDRLEDALALCRMRAKHGQLLRCELAGLVEPIVADADLAHVV